MSIKIPRLFRRQVKAMQSWGELNDWAGKVDQTLAEILRSLQEIVRRLAPITDSMTETTGLAPHASTHLPLGSDALATALPGTIRPDDTASVGTANAFARSDHRHAVVADPPVNIGSANTEGASTSFARADHVHNHPVFASGDLHTDLLPLSGVRDMTGELGTDVGTFRSDVASGGTGFIFNTSNSFASGSIFSFRDNGTRMLEQDFEGHAALIASVAAPSATVLFKAEQTLVDDSRSIIGILTRPEITGAIPGASYSVTIDGVQCRSEFEPTSFPAAGNKTIRGGNFNVILASGSGNTINTVLGGLFQVQASANSSPVTNLAVGRFQVSGLFSAGVTDFYGIQQLDLGTNGTNRWGGSFANRVAIASTVADAQEVLSLTQSNTGATAGVHVKFNDKAGDPPAPVAGDLWRNANVLKWRTATATADLAQVAGQLGATGDSPDVRGLRETAGPTLLTMGAVTDGQFLKRSGTTIIGDVSAGGGISSNEFFLDFGTREVAFV